MLWFFYWRSLDSRKKPDIRLIIAHLKHNIEWQEAIIIGFKAVWSSWFDKSLNILTQEEVEIRLNCMSWRIMYVHIYVSFVEWLLLCSRRYTSKNKKQAGAELGQAQPKLG